MKRIFGALTAVLATALLVGPLAVGGPAAPAPAAPNAEVAPSAVAPNFPPPGTLLGGGFDACTAPSQQLMTTWLAASPYRAVGIYIAGINRFCTQPLLTPGWVSTQLAAGWHLMPIYLGLQPYCTTSTKEFRFTAANAVASGRAAADEAVAAAQGLGLPRESAIFLDIEAYSTTDATCRSAVLNFQSAWTARLHDVGYLSGFYSSLASGIADQVAVYPSASYVRPDYLWFARYDGVATVTDPSIPTAYWPSRRIKQYQSPTQTGGPETWGGLSLSVDRNRLDVAAVPRTAFGDFTGNGWSDLIARRISTGALQLYAGNGNGFGAVSQIGSGWGGMDSITRLGDFDGDGYDDVIAREKATGTLWLYRWTGSRFAAKAPIGKGWSGMREITPIGDLTGDGRADVIAVQSSSGCLYLYPGNGSTLTQGQRVGCGWTGLRELAGVGDFNRDGRVDFVARQDATGELWLYRGAAGGFSTRVRVGTGWNGMRDIVGVGDFDRDGWTDVIAVNTASGSLLRFPGRGASLGSGLRVGSGWGDLRPLL